MTGTLTVSEAVDSVLELITGDYLDEWTSFSDALALSWDDFLGNQGELEKENHRVLRMFEVWEQKNESLTEDEKEAILERAVNLIDNPELLEDCAKLSLGDKIKLLRERLTMEVVSLFGLVGMTWELGSEANDKVLSEKHKAMLQEWLQEENSDVGNKVEKLSRAADTLGLQQLREALPDPDKILEDLLKIWSADGDSNTIPGSQLIAIHTNGQIIRRKHLTVTSLDMCDEKARLPDIPHEATPCSNVLKLVPQKTMSRIKLEIPIIEEGLSESMEQVLCYLLKKRWMDFPVAKVEKTDASMTLEVDSLKETLVLVAVRRLKLDHAVIHNKGGQIRSTAYDKVAVNIPEYTFDSQQARVTLQVEDVATQLVSSTFMAGVVCSPFIHFSADAKPQQALNFTVPQGDDEQNEGVDHVLRRSDGHGRWSHVPDAPVTDEDGAKGFSMACKTNSETLTVARADKKISKNEVLAKVSRFDRTIHTTKALVFFRQLKNNPKNCLIVLCHEQSKQQAEDKVQQMGFTLKQDDFETDVMAVTNKQKIRIAFDSGSNVEFQSKRPKFMTFSMDTEIATVNCKVVPKKRDNIWEEVRGRLVVEKLGSVYNMKDLKFTMLIDLDELPEVKKERELNETREHEGIRSNVEKLRNHHVVISKWKALAERFGLTNSIPDIKKRTGKRFGESLYEVSELWIKRNKRKATIEKLNSCLTCVVKVPKGQLKAPLASIFL